MQRFRINHYADGMVDEVPRRIQAPAIVASDAETALAEFVRYCDLRLGPSDSANLVDDDGRVILTRTGKGG